MSEEQLAASAESQSSIQESEVKETKSEKSDEKEPKWLPERLERERRSILKQLGVDKIDDAKVAIAKLKELQDSQKSEVEKLREQLKEYESAKSQLDAYRSSTEKLAEAELSRLSVEQREVVLALAGDNPASQIKAIEKLKPTWGASAKTETAPAVLRAPATTSPPASAPQQHVSSEPNKRQTWESLKEKNPVLASAYLMANKSEIFQQK